MAKSERSVVLKPRALAAVGRRVAREARRQSLLVGSRVSERDTIVFVEALADDRGWRNCVVKRR
jgi:hypothetical protein